MDFPSFHHGMSLSGQDSPAARITRLYGRLTPGDQAIAWFLTALTGIALLIGAAALVRSFQVPVPAEGGGFTEGVVGSPRFVNPLLAISETDRDLVALTYAGLMGHGADGSLVPVLAESYAVSGDGTVYTFTLRADAAFHDGTPVTADDVVFTVEKVQDPGLKSPMYANWANVRAEAADPRTVRFTLPEPYAPFLEDTTLGILPLHIWRNVTNEEFPFSPYATRPVGAGPFAVDRVRTDAEGVITRYSLSAFDEYALGRPYLDGISFRFFDDAVALRAALEDGTVDSAYGIARDGVHTAPYARVIGVFFNGTANPFLEDPLVREALSVAINRQALAEEVLGGYATPAVGPLPAGSAAAELPVPDPLTQLDDARALLEEAGWEFDIENVVWVKDGEELRMTLTTSSVPELRTVAAHVQGNWQALGVPTEVEYFDPGVLMQNVIRPRTAGALLFGQVVGQDPDLYAFWASAGIEDPGLNITGFADEDVDGLLTLARAQSGDEKRATLAEAERLIAEAHPAAFLYTPDFLYSAPRKVEDISLSEVSSPADRFRGVHAWHRYTEYVWPWFL